MRDRNLVVLAGLIFCVARGNAQIAFQTGTITGTVTTTAGLVPPGEYVRATSTTNGSSTAAYTDANGAYTLILPVDNYQLVAFYQNAAVGTAAVAVVADQSTTQSFTYGAGTLRVHLNRNEANDVGAPVVVDAAPPSSCPASGTSCSYYDAANGICQCTVNGAAFRCDPNFGCKWDVPASFNAMTDSSGTAAVLVPVGTYSGTVGSSQSGGGMGSGAGQSGSITVGTIPTTTVNDGDDLLVGDVSYDTGSVTGHVTAGGSPLTNVNVRADAGSLGAITAWVDYTGAYSLVLPTLATYTIQALQNGATVIGFDGNVTVTAGATLALDFIEPGAFVSGTVVRDGAAAAFAAATFEQPPPTCGNATSCDYNDPLTGACRCTLNGSTFTCQSVLVSGGGSGSGSGSGSATGSQYTQTCKWDVPQVITTSADASGVFRTFVPTGLYELTVYSAPEGQGSASGQVGSVIVGAGSASVGSNAVDVGTFSYATGAITGSFTSCGQPLPGVQVQAANVLGTITSIPNAGGNYLLRVPTGSYNLTASLNGFGAQLASQQDVRVDAEGVTFSGSHDLGQLRGLIVANGLPAAFASVTADELAPATLSCSTATSCMWIDQTGQYCQCSANGRMFSCDPTFGCKWWDPHVYAATTGTDGFFTIDSIEPADYDLLAYSNAGGGGGGSGSGSAMMPPPGGGGILVGSFDVTVAACKLTEVGVSDVPVAGGTNESVDIGDGIALTFSSVDSGIASYTATSTPPAGATPQFQSAGLFYDITVPPFTGTVTLCFPYDVEALPPGADLHLYHDQVGVGWVDITTSIDSVNHIVCGSTSSFSVFAVGYAQAAPLAISGPSQVPADDACVGHVTLSASGAANGTTYHWFLGDVALGDGSSLTAALPLGTSSVRVVAGTASATASVKVVDTTPPSLSVAVAPATLWPPNGKLVSIAATPTVKDNCDPHPSFAVVDATSTTAAPGDIVVQAPSSLQLRAFRAGAETAGRTYTIRYTAGDAAGNHATFSANVTVPHDQR
jgi:hypothetical protein